MIQKDKFIRLNTLRDSPDQLVGVGAAMRAAINWSRFFNPQHGSFGSFTESNI